MLLLCFLRLKFHTFCTTKNHKKDFVVLFARFERQTTLQGSMFLFLVCGKKLFIGKKPRENVHIYISKSGEKSQKIT
jgi:hypothetical protein